MLTFAKYSVTTYTIWVSINEFDYFFVAKERGVYVCMKYLPKRVLFP